MREFAAIIFKTIVLVFIVPISIVCLIFRDVSGTKEIYLSVDTWGYRHSSLRDQLKTWGKD